MTDERRVSPAPGALASLVSRLKSRPNLVGVAITGAPNADMAQEEYIEFHGIEEGAVFSALGRGRKDHEFTLSGLITVGKQGADDDLATSVRERAYEFLDEIDDELKATLEGLQLFNERGRRMTLTSRLAQRNLDQVVTATHRVALIEFTIDCFDQTLG